MHWGWELCPLLTITLISQQVGGEHTKDTWWTLMELLVENTFQMPRSFLHMQTLFFKKTKKQNLIKSPANSNIFLYKKSQSASKNTFTIIYCSIFEASLNQVRGQSLSILAGNSNVYSLLVDFFFQYQFSFFQWVKSFNHWFKSYMTKSLVRWSSFSIMPVSALCCSVP